MTNRTPITLLLLLATSSCSYDYGKYSEGPAGPGSSANAGQLAAAGNSGSGAASSNGGSGGVSTGGSTGGSPATGGQGPSCNAPELDCGGNCVDVTKSASQCGSCENACSGTLSCSASLCGCSVDSQCGSSVAFDRCASGHCVCNGASHCRCNDGAACSAGKCL